MEKVRIALSSLTSKVCGLLEKIEIHEQPVWTVVEQPGQAPHVALDPTRPAISEIQAGLSLRLLGMPEYKSVALAIAEEPGLQDGIIIDVLGGLQKPEETNITRALVANFLWGYLGEGTQLGWDQTRFDEAFDALIEELEKKSILFQLVVPLSNLKIEVDSIEFDEELRLAPASVEELERWLNPNDFLGVFGSGRPRWDNNYVDRPAVLHARRNVVGSPPSKSFEPGRMPRFNIGPVITALRLVMEVPTLPLFQEQRNEGLMTFGSGGTSWTRTAPPSPFQIATLDEKHSNQVKAVWDALQNSPNVDQLKLPLRRWESAISRPNLEDSLIDAWISLEALLLGGQTAELSFRAAVHLAEFLGTSGSERKQIFEEAKISYTWRSVIVHGSSSKRVAKKQSLNKTTEITLDRLRSALLRVLELPHRFDPSKLESDLLSRD